MTGRTSGRIPPEGVKEVNEVTFFETELSTLNCIEQEISALSVRGGKVPSHGLELYVLVFHHLPKC